MVVASSGALDSAPAIAMELSVCRGLDALGAGRLILSTRGRSVLAVLGPSSLCLSQGEARSWAVSSVPSAPGPALLDSGSQWCSRLSMELPPNPLHTAPRAVQPPPHGASSSAGAAPEVLPGHATPFPLSSFLSHSELFPGQCAGATAL